MQTLCFRSFLVESWIYGSINYSKLLWSRSFKSAPEGNITITLNPNLFFSEMPTVVTQVIGFRSYSSTWDWEFHIAFSTDKFNWISYLLRYMLSKFPLLKFNLDLKYLTMTKTQKQIRQQILFHSNAQDIWEQNLLSVSLTSQKYDHMI